MDAPCKGCTRRKELCHSVCQAYLDFRASKEEEYKIRMRVREYCFAHDDAICRSQRIRGRNNFYINAEAVKRGKAKEH